MALESSIKALDAHAYDDLLVKLYVDEALLPYQRARYSKLLRDFKDAFGAKEVKVCSAPGRSEIIGNHTDHQHGCVVATAVNLDALAAATRQKRYVDIISDGKALKRIDLTDLAFYEEEKGTSESLVKGVLKALKDAGYQIGGFQAYLTSDVKIGAGLSSSAAFEMLIAVIIEGLYNKRIDRAVMAKAGQYAENVYFGKPSGLMDQCASAFGGLIHLDFSDTEALKVQALNVNFQKFAHRLCIVDTKGSHADLTAEYAAIPNEMHAVAAYFHKEYLAEVPVQDFYAHLAKLKGKVSDRAVLRAHHFFQENRRVEELVRALKNDSFTDFKRLIKESGDSSFKYLQNVFNVKNPEHQGLALALAISEEVLGQRGVVRVHGGGFAGTIQAFVAEECAQEYVKTMDRIFGKGSCQCLEIRQVGCTTVF